MNKTTKTATRNETVPQKKELTIEDLLQVRGGSASVDDDAIGDCGCSEKCKCKNESAVE